MSVFSHEHRYRSAERLRGEGLKLNWTSQVDARKPRTWTREFIVRQTLAAHSIDGRGFSRSCQGQSDDLQSSTTDARGMA